MHTKISLLFIRYTEKYFNIFNFSFSVEIQSFTTLLALNFRKSAEE